MNSTDKSFTNIGLKSQRYTEFKSKTPSPAKIIPKQDSNDKMISNLFAINKRKKKEGIVEHLIENLLKSEGDPESPKGRLRLI